MYKKKASNAKQCQRKASPSAFMGEAGFCTFVWFVTPLTPFPLLLLFDSGCVLFTVPFAKFSVLSLNLLLASSGRNWWLLPKCRKSRKLESLAERQPKWDWRVGDECEKELDLIKGFYRIQSVIKTFSPEQDHSRFGHSHCCPMQVHFQAVGIECHRCSPPMPPCVPSTCSWERAACNRMESILYFLPISH